jgi:hypothetical protein
VKETAWQGEMALLFEGFIGGGLQSGDGVILIATEKHLKALANRVMQKGLISKPPARTSPRAVYGKRIAG